MKKYRLAIAVAGLSLVCVALTALWLGRPDSGTRQPAPVQTGAGRTAESAAPGIGPGTGQPSAAGKQEVPSAGTSPNIEVAKSTPASPGSGPFPSGPAGPPATGAQPTASGAQPAATPAPLMPPKSLAGFYSWPEHKQVEAVTALMENVHLPRDVRNFFTAALMDNRLSSLVRNNMLNALENQDPINHDLWRTLAAIIDDPKQDKEWRLFAVQHLGVVYADSSDRKSVESKLRGLFQGNDPEFSAQAMTTLDNLGGDGLIALGADFDSALVRKIQSPASDVSARNAALALIGRRGVREQLPLVRGIARDPSSPLQRTAFATLGQIGDASDIPLIEPYLRSRDRTLREAAKGALARLKAKGTQPG